MDGSFAAVIANDEYLAVKALEQMEKSARWLPGNAQAGISDNWNQLSTVEAATYDSGNQSHTAEYTKPYIMHGSIGPSCAIALFEQGSLCVWSHSQGVYPLRATLSNLLGLAESRIRVIGVRGSGCYGHNGADDVAAEAALLAKAFPGRPVRLQWQRQDEHTVEPYGSAMKMKLAASLGADGRITSWKYDLWTDMHSSRPRGQAGHFFSARHLQAPFPFESSGRVGGGTRNAEPYYQIPNPTIEGHHVQGPLRVSALRSLGAYANIFAIESFMDELAEKAGIAPLDFRLNHLEDERAIAVITRLRELTNGITLSPGEGIGYGFSRYKNTASYCAVAARIKVDAEQKIITPIKMWAVIDAGETLNPEGLKNQTEGGMIQAAFLDPKGTSTI